MSGAPFDQLDEMEQNQLREAADRAIYYQRPDEAEEAARKLLEAAPNSTTTWELWGDVLRAQGNLAEASAAFEKARELEPANADAERKYASVQLDLSQAERQRELLESGSLEDLRGAFQKAPGTAAARSAFFPGLGQAYNGDYERAIVMFACAFILLIPAVRLLVTWISPAQEISALGATFGYLGLFGFFALYIFSVYDAYRSGERGTDQQPLAASPKPSEITNTDDTTVD